MPQASKHPAHLIQQNLVLQNKNIHELKLQHPNTATPLIQSGDVTHHPIPIVLLPLPQTQLAALLHSRHRLAFAHQGAAARAA
jgi:hypothetical protein